MLCYFLFIKGDPACSRVSVVNKVWRVLINLLFGKEQMQDARRKTQDADAHNISLGNHMYQARMQSGPLSAAYTDQITNGTMNQIAWHGGR